MTTPPGTDPNMDPSGDPAMGTFDPSAPAQIDPTMTEPNGEPSNDPGFDLTLTNPDFTTPGFGPGEPTPDPMVGLFPVEPTTATPTGTTSGTTRFGPTLFSFHGFWGMFRPFTAAPSKSTAGASDPNGGN